jgi:hypothetical protein
MFGRTPRGPIALLADSWSQTSDDTEKPVYVYLFELKNIIAEACEVAQENSAQSARKNKTHFDKKAKPRSFTVDDEVLVLLPTESNKLLMTWSGPSRVSECLHPDYRIEMKGKSKIFQANMLKRYLRRENSAAVVVEDHGTSVSVGTFTPWSEICAPSFCESASQNMEIRQPEPLPTVPTHESPLQSTAVGVIQDDDDDVVSVPSLPTPMSPSTQQEDINMIDFNIGLKPSESQELVKVFSEFTDCLTTNPGIFTLLCLASNHMAMSSNRLVCLQILQVPLGCAVCLANRSQTTDLPANQQIQEFADNALVSLTSGIPVHGGTPARFAECHCRSAVPCSL